MKNGGPLLGLFEPRAGVHTPIIAITTSNSMSVKPHYEQPRWMNRKHSISPDVRALNSNPANFIGIPLSTTEVTSKCRLMGRGWVKIGQESA